MESQNCKFAKEAWNILELAYECYTTVKRSKLSMLTTKFENIRIEENETFYEFYAKFNETVNSSHSLGEKILKFKLVSKILRSLPKRFQAKVSDIEEGKDIETTKTDKVVGPFITYEINLPPQEKGKTLVLKIINENLQLLILMMMALK